MKKLLVICGPTATGKTALGIKLAKKYNGEIVSADSRQVYRGMDIGTGKDLPQNSKLIIQNSKLGTVYEIDGVTIYGYDLVNPTEEFSISQYLKVASRAVGEIYKSGKLPIIVGGTGFYIKGIVDGIPTVDVPRNEDLRVRLELRSANELFESLSVIDSLKAGNLNSSDKKNPRRLIRAIEIAQFSLDHKLSMNRFIDSSNLDTLFIGLTAPQDYLESRIYKRVDERIQNGFEEEVKKLIKSGVDWSHQSMYSLGYRQWRDYFEGAVEKEIAVSEWEKEERKYAKRQLVWFKKDPRINWFNITESGFPKNVENMTEKWYLKS